MNGDFSIGILKKIKKNKMLIIPIGILMKNDHLQLFFKIIVINKE